jgi:hypothetical protein
MMKWDTHLCGFEVNKHVMVIMYRMGVCMGVTTPALEVFTADETPIYVEVEG